MILNLLRWSVLAIAIAPFAYYLIATYCGWSYFRAVRKTPLATPGFTPPVSILKPVRGLDREAYENFASFCCLDYPVYEVLFGVVDEDDPVIPVIRRLQHDFPDCAIRLLVGAPSLGTSPKMTNLSGLVREPKYELLVINDSDVRVDPDYLRNATAPFRDPKVGVVTALFRSITAGNFATDLDAIGVPSDSSASALIARKFGAIDFALGWTMATTKERLKAIGGFEAMADSAARCCRFSGLGGRILLQHSFLARKGVSRQGKLPDSLARGESNVRHEFGRSRSGYLGDCSGDFGLFQENERGPDNFLKLGHSYCCAPSSSSDQVADESR